MLQKEGFAFIDTFKVEGLQTADDAIEINILLKAIPGVSDVVVSQKKNTITITSLEPVDAILLQEKLKQFDLTITKED